MTDEYVDLLDDDDADTTPAEPRPRAFPWRLLIVDDEPDVHTVTRYALRSVNFQDRPIEFLSAHSAAEGLQLLKSETDIACVLLDVVMETETAGLDLARKLRDDLDNHQIRIVLRTGQPGYAPEIDVIQQYEINDYKTKSELTQAKLITAICTAFRSYQEICIIEAGRRGLELIVESSTSLMAERAVRKFAAGVITHIAGLIGARPEGFFMVKSTSPSAADMEILAAVGSMADRVGATIENVPDEAVRLAIQAAIQKGEHYVAPDRLVLHMETRSNEAILVHIELTREISAIDRQLLDVFASNVGVGFENSRLFEEVQFLAYRDGLTGFFNRTGFQRELSGWIEAGRPFKVASVDLDGFHRFNDGLGDSIGNEILKAAAERLRACLPADAIVARIHSDSFAFAAQAENVELMTAQCADIVLAFSELLEADGHQIPIPATVGIVSWPEQGDDAVMLLNRAGAVVRFAKSHGGRGGVHHYEPLSEQRIQNQVRLVQAARPALGGQEISMVYQPKVDLRTGRLAGMEALMRWRRPDGSVVAPAEFIPAFEASGEIIHIGRWMTNHVANQIQRWRAAGLNPPPVAINVSAVQLKDPDVVSTMLDAVKSASIEIADLELEITESVFVGESQTTLEKLDALSQLGFALALDDFGTGYSSLSYIQLLPLTYLKIDRAFVQHVGGEQRDAALAKSILAMAIQLGLKSIAEGVETDVQHELVREWGCDYGQGYLYGKPLTVDAMTDRLKETADAVALAGS